MFVVCVNYFYDRELSDPEATLVRYHTLTGWAEGLQAAGAEVAVIQRFGTDAEQVRNGVSYRFVRDPSPKLGSVLDFAPRMNRAVAALRPDVIHANGLTFARQAVRLKRALPLTPILAQDHAEKPPKRWINRVTLRNAFKRLSGVSFAAAELAEPWRASGVLPAATLVPVLMEGSSRFQLQDRAEARAKTGIEGDPLCLWVGRLDSNKDPLTILEGFALALESLPRARLAMVYSADALLPAVKSWLSAHPKVAERVTLLGRLPHAELEAVYNSADFFLLGSHHEGSGYAVLEALACGVVPIITDIPTFRTLTDNGAIGGLFPGKNTGMLAQILQQNVMRHTPATPLQIRHYFDAHWSYEAIGRAALQTYQELGKTER